ncbi:MAG: hypothetical protein NVSMB18_26960 [Acetobacteraceae bacterium]
MIPKWPLSGTYPLDGFGTGLIALQRQGVTVAREDTFGDPQTDPVVWASIQTRAFVSVPLVRDGRLRATMFVTDRKPRAWSDGEVRLITDVATGIWDALERARAEAELRRTNESLENLVAERTATLQANEARLRTIFQSSYQLQGLLAPDGVLLDTNTASLTAAGAKLADVIGRPFWDTPWFTSTPGMPAVIKAAVLAAGSGQSVQRELTLMLGAGKRIYEFGLRPVRDAAGAVVAIVPEAVDITGRRQAEEQLRQSQKMEAVGQLTGGIAHDFNNLLAGITGSLELLGRRLAAGRTDGLERYTSAAMAAAQRAAALVQRLLAFARRQPLDPKRVDANRLVASMEELLRRTMGPAIELELRLASGLWPILCDPNQLESALLNLTINARDAMPEGGSLRIETRNAALDEVHVGAQGEEVGPGQYVAIGVTDTGVGMPPNVVAKVFDPFFTTKPLGQGTGLGLSMLYGFITQSGGQVRVASEVGRGTTLVLYLPRLRGEMEEAGDPAMEASDRQSGTGETVLVVEDEPTVRMLITETLHELGYAALEAADGPSGLLILQSAQRIDLLVTDVGLPGLNGRQLADAARVHRPGLRVLFITGYAHNAALGDGTVLEPGMAMITKPFALDALAAKIRSMLEAGVGGDEVPSRSPP